MGGTFVHEAFVLEDDFHAERLRKFDTLEEPLAELRQLEGMTSAELAKAIGPAPCADHCGRRELRIIEETGRIVAEVDPIE
jgi:hypothetical protein